MSPRTQTTIVLVGVAVITIGYTLLPSTVWARSSFHGSNSQNVSSVQGGNTTGAAGSANVSAPRDAASGQASGKRQHKPIKFIKEWDAATP